MRTLSRFESVTPGSNFLCKVSCPVPEGRNIYRSNVTKISQLRRSEMFFTDSAYFAAPDLGSLVLVTVSINIRLLRSSGHHVAALGALRNLWGRSPLQTFYELFTPFL